ncbi:RNA-directed DNA polymerase [Methylobacterium sp. 1973]|uniref:RNA-directed DNA polymerase n=1 Tax=Methylobacterium sp. 1973 TaxID=3156421 RepID=UPI00339ACC1F
MNAFNNILSSMLSKGYFPKELPQAFTSESFGQNAFSIIEAWRTSEVFQTKPAGKVPGTAKKKSSSFNYELAHADMEVISKPKRGYERRDIHLTHPIPQALLTYEIANNWRSIQKWLGRQKFSIDKIKVSENYPRSIKGIQYSVHLAKKGHIEAVSNWIVKTDISRFYSTIYTHSIPWAAYGKESVKSNLRMYQGSLADRLDALVRASNRNQTVGIPVGPETSRVISEIISSRIDDNFGSLVSGVEEGRVDRLQDDWLVGADTFEQAENVLSVITKVYREFGLEINGSKTTVNRMIAISGGEWISEINAFLSHRSGAIKGSRLREFLSLTLRLQAKYPYESVTSYTLTIIESQRIFSADVEIVEAFLLKAAVISPISMDRICRIIINLQFTSHNVSTSRIGKRFERLAEIAMVNGSTYEAIWLLYTLRGLRIRLNSRIIVDHIENYASSVVALILLDMQSKGLCARALPKDEWISRHDKQDILTSWSWLLMYEGIRLGWIQDRKALMNEPFFREMSNHNVYFYDQTKNVRNSRSVIKNNVRQRKIASAEVSTFLRKIREMSADDY